jgi:hypothetical protein
MKFGVTFDFAKADNDGRFVRGWASVAVIDGQTVTDTQDDRVTMDELRKAAHRFVTDARVAKAMHAGAQVGEVVESVMIDDGFAAALGVTDTKRGWWIGMRINDDGIAKRVKSGELKAFSIGGRGRRKKVD